MSFSVFKISDMYFLRFKIKTYSEPVSPMATSINRMRQISALLTKNSMIVAKPCGEWRTVSGNVARPQTDQVKRVNIPWKQNKYLRNQQRN